MAVIESVNPNDAPAASAADDKMAEYFANKPRAEIGRAVMSLVDDYYEHLETSGRLALLKRCYKYYYQGMMRGGRLRTTGEQDEYLDITVNHLRNILIHLRVNVTGTRPSYDPKAVNTDYKSQGQTIVANGIMEYYSREKNLDQVFDRAAEQALVFSEAYVSAEWDTQAGNDYMQNPNEPGKTVKEGDIVFGNFTPLDAVVDFTRPSGSDQEWIILRVWKNKYTMAAKYPDLAEQILSLSCDERQLNKRRFVEGKLLESNLVPVYRMYHARTAAVPGGRLVECLSKDIVAIDGSLPYKKIPVSRITPDEQDGTPFGYTIAFDLLPIQMTIDALYSIVVTNQSSFGVQNIQAPKGSNLSVTQLAGGLNLIEFDAQLGKIESLNLTDTPQEIFNFIEKLEKLMEVLSGVNSVARGNPEASLKSGAALALVASQAIQFNSKFQSSYNQLLESVGSNVIEILKMYANTPRMVAIAGKANRSLMKEFTGKDLSNITRVSVDMGNPLSRTVAGKMEIADKLIDSGLIKTADEYIQVATTGRLEPLIEGQQAQLLLVRAENEELAEGRPTQALATDDHRLHIVEHNTVLASPEARQNPKIVQTALAHILEHITLLKTTDPVLLGLYGQPMVPQAPPPPPSSGNGGAPKAGPPMDVQNPVTKAAESVAQPAMPENPLTGRRYDPAVGQ